MFITVFTKVRHWTLSWDSRIHFARCDTCTVFLRYCKKCTDFQGFIEATLRFRNE